MKLKKTLVGAAVLAMVALAGPALASGNTYTVSVGGSTANVASPLSAASTTTLSFVAQRPAPTYSTNLNMSCASANLTGTSSVVNGGTSGGASPTNIATLPAIKFNTCSGPGGAITATTLSTMQLHGTSTATSGSSDVISGHIEGVSVKVKNAVCEFNVTGSANGSFNEATQQLTVNESTFNNLTYTLVSGCLGQLPATGKANFSGTFQVSSAAINVLP